MSVPSEIKPKNEKGYHVRNFDPKARRLAKAGASVAGVDIGAWISQAVREKFARDISRAPAKEADL
jgi:hypothetical protein